MIDGEPGLVVSPTCKYVRKGLAGGYNYRRLQIAGQERYRDVPDKNQFSHPVEACEYMALGAGEGERVVMGENFEEDDFDDDDFDAADMTRSAIGGY